MPFGTNAPLRVMVVSRLMIRTSGCARVSSCRAVPPNIRELDSSWNSSVHLLGEANIIPGRLDVALMKKRVTGMGQDLIYSPSPRIDAHQSCCSADRGF